VRHGDTFEIGEVGVHAYGEKHATIHPDVPLVDNVCFLFDGTVFHPGDSFTVPEERVPTLLAPLAAPWCKLSEVVDYVREVAPDQVFPIHSAVLSDPGREISIRLVTGLAGDPEKRPVHAWSALDQFDIA